MDKEYEILKLKYEEVHSGFITISVILFSLLVGLFTTPNEVAKRILFVSVLLTGIVYFILMIINNKRYTEIHNHLSK